MELHMMQGAVVISYHASGIRPDGLVRNDMENLSHDRWKWILIYSITQSTWCSGKVAGNSVYNNHIQISQPDYMEHSSSWKGDNISVKKLPAFYGTRRFCTVFTTVHHLFLYWAWLIQCTRPSYLLKQCINVISPATPRFSLCMFFRISLSNPKCTSPLSSTCYMSRPSNSSWSSEKNMVRSTGQETAHYAVSFCPLLPPCS